LGFFRLQKFWRNFTMKIANFTIGPDHPPFIVAEMSGNHNHSLERALAIVEAAAAVGAHAVKLQTYTADTMTLDIDAGEFVIDDPGSLWRGNTLYRLYRQAYTPWEWHGTIFKRCRELGMAGFSTPFDVTAVDFLEELEVPCYKIAAFENTDLPLIRRVAATGKPLMISTGMATAAELDEAVRTAREAGCRDLVLLKCTSNYPAAPQDSNLRTLPHLRELFGCEVGLSDHTMGVGAALASVALGATVIEKHFTLSRAEGGVDAAFSMEPEELRILLAGSRQAREALGAVVYGPAAAEEPSLKHRRSLYFVTDLHAGDTITAEQIRAIRPGMGLAPKYFETVLGRKVKWDIRKGTPVNWDALA
jgi:pseudaminic acid synthase